MIGMFALPGCPTEAPTDAPPNPMGGQPPQGEGGGAPGAPSGEGGAGGAGGAGSMGPPALAVTAGEGVMLSGTIEYSGTLTGFVRVDLSDKDGKVVHTISMEKVGDWQAEVPKDYGEIKITGFIDATGDGPSDYEPKAEITTTVAALPVTGLTLALQEGTGTVPPEVAGRVSPGAGTAPPPGDGPGPVPGEGGGPGGAAPSEGGPPSGAPPDGSPPAGGEGKAGGATEGKAPGAPEGKAAGKAETKAPG